MRLAATALFAASLAVGGCGIGGEAEIHIIDFAPAQSSMFSIPMPGPDAVLLNLHVRSRELKSVLDRGGAVDLLVFDCGAPDGSGETVALYFGGEPITGLYGRQVSDDPDMLALLSAAVPQRAVDLKQPCARFVRHPGLFGPEVISRPVPLPSS